MNTFNLQSAITVRDRSVLGVKPLTQEQSDTMFSGPDSQLNLESATFEEIQETLFDGVPYFDEPEQLLSAITTKSNRLSRTMAAFCRELDKGLGGKITSGEEYYSLIGEKLKGKTVSSAIVSKPRKVGAYAVVTALIPLSDGQSVSVLFYAPDDDPLKVNDTDTLIAFRFLLNKRDITHIVAPIKGKDLSLKQTVGNIAELALKNTDKFTANRAKQAEQNEALTSIQDETERLLEAAAAMADEVEELKGQKSTVAKDIASTKAKLDKLNEANESLKAEVKADEPVNAGDSLRLSLNDEEKAKLAKLEEHTNFEVKLGKQSVTLPNGEVRNLNMKDNAAFKWDVDVLWSHLLSALSDKALSGLELLMAQSKGVLYRNKEGENGWVTLGSATYSNSPKLPDSYGRYAIYMRHELTADGSDNAPVFGENAAIIVPIYKDGEYGFAAFRDKASKEPEFTFKTVSEMESEDLSFLGLVKATGQELDELGRKGLLPADKQQAFDQAMDAIDRSAGGPKDIDMTPQPTSKDLPELKAEYKPLTEEFIAAEKLADQEANLARKVLNKINRGDAYPRATKLQLLINGGWEPKLRKSNASGDVYNLYKDGAWRNVNLNKTEQRFTRWLIAQKGAEPQSANANANDELNQPTGDSSLDNAEKASVKPALARIKERVIKDGNRDIINSLNTIRDIDNGTVVGMTRALFVSSVAGKVKTLAKNGAQDKVNNVLTMIAEYNAIAAKPLISLRNGIWKLGEVLDVVSEDESVLKDADSHIADTEEVFGGKANHWYGLRVRPYDINAQPSGVVTYLDPQKASVKFPELSEREVRFGAVAYEQPLNQKDIDGYSLTDIANSGKPVGDAVEGFDQVEEWIESYLKAKYGAVSIPSSDVPELVESFEDVKSYLEKGQPIISVLLMTPIKQQVLDARNADMNAFEKIERDVNAADFDSIMSILGSLVEVDDKPQEPTNGSQSLSSSDETQEVEQSEESKQIGSLDGSSFEFGSEWQKEKQRDTKVIAKQISKHISQLKKSNALPKDVKVSVRSDYNSITMNVTGLPSSTPLFSDAYLANKELDDGANFNAMDKHSSEVKTLLEYIKRFAGQFNYDNSDIDQDVSDKNFYSTVKVDLDLANERIPIELANYKQRKKALTPDAAEKPPVQPPAQEQEIVPKVNEELEKHLAEAKSIAQGNIPDLKVAMDTLQSAIEYLQANDLMVEHEAEIQTASDELTKALLSEASKVISD
uniref:Phage protein n=2 Tax=Vibrio TaxID=662 RepID=A0A0H3ZU54_9VIBR|nr:Phage protein [Vibrio cyclitrophicus]AKN38230.1 hypothetical protein [Vibrio splendidus]